MKTFLIPVAALSLLFLFGCESTINEPNEISNTKFVGALQENPNTYKDVFTFTYPNVMKLEGLLYDPSHRLNSFAKIDGVVRYGFSEVNSIVSDETNIDFNKTKPSDISPSKKWKIKIFVNASLKADCPINDRKWTVKKAAEQIVTVNTANQSLIFIEKSFRVQNTCCAPLDLLLKFEVIERELRLVSMELKLVVGLEPIDDEE